MLNVSMHQGAMAVVWLALVLLLILGAARAARYLPARLRQPKPLAGQATGNALALRGSLALDLRRRVHLIEASGNSVLILTGGATDLMVDLKKQES